MRGPDAMPFWGRALAAGLLLALGGCLGTVAPDTLSDTATVATHQECVTYARGHSQVKIYGDAYTWWDKAAGVFARGPVPLEGAVMVLHNCAGTERAHLAVVRRLISPREIRIDHVNWFDVGAIYVNDPVMDVSAANDWSQVRVWNIRDGNRGARIYPVKGFIGPDRSDAFWVAGLPPGEAAP